MEDIPTAEVDILLGHFAMKVRKQNGEEYEPNSITVFFRSFDRYLKDKGQTRSVIQDKEFEGARRVLEAKRKNLRKQGKGRKQNAAEALTVDEEEKLWSTKQLGDHSPHSLLQTVWYFNTMHFGWRGSDEHRCVCLGDLHLRKACKRLVPKIAFVFRVCLSVCLFVRSHVSRAQYYVMRCYATVVYYCTNRFGGL